MRAQHGKDTPKLKGKCSSCGTNFSDHMGLVGTCAELQSRMESGARNHARLTKALLEIDKSSEELQKFKPIACKDRMPEEFPCFIWDTDFERWLCCPSIRAFNERKTSHWLLMLPKPE